MSQQPLSSRILAGAITFVGLGMAWMAIVSNLPTQQELSAKESTTHAVPAPPLPEPVLDLSIPGVRATPQASETQPAATADMTPASTPTDPRAAQVVRLRCEAEVEQLCPEASDGSGRRQCLEKRAQQLSAPCHQQMRERLVKWKEERSRLTLACQADMKRFCPDVKAGGGQTLQCLQHHAQELSDGCYGMLPKGTLYLKQ
jgi:cysteine rich repeat protein